MIIQSVGSVQFCVEKGHLLKTRMSNVYFVTLGMLAHAVLVWRGVRATGLTIGQPTTGQVQDKYRTSTGQLQLQDNYRTNAGHCPTVKPALRTLSCPPLMVTCTQINVFEEGSLLPWVAQHTDMAKARKDLQNLVGVVNMHRRSFQRAF